jgi:ABC-type polysaccharide/polyol phosphate transport system ATPase subunit
LYQEVKTGVFGSNGAGKCAISLLVQIAAPTA